MPWRVWTGERFDDPALTTELYDKSGAIRPAAFDAFLAREGVDIALLLSEYSPKVTGIQPIEDMLPLVARNPSRIRPIANINPHYHYPVGTIGTAQHPVKRCSR